MLRELNQETNQCSHAPEHSEDDKIQYLHTDEQILLSANTSASPPRYSFQPQDHPLRSQHRHQQTQTTDRCSPLSPPPARTHRGNTRYQPLCRVSARPCQRRSRELTMTRAGEAFKRRRESSDGDITRVVDRNDRAVI